MDTRPDRTHRLALLAVIAASLLLMTLSAVNRFWLGAVWDDSHMYVRYVDNLFEFGRLCWNPDGKPTYGLTSVLYILAVIPARLLVPDNAAMAVWFASVGSSVLFLVLLAVLLARHSGLKGISRLRLMAYVFFFLALQHNMTVFHFTGGMDTAFALAGMTGYLILIARLYERPGWNTALAAGLFGGTFFFARPDMMIFPVLVPAFLLLDPKMKEWRGAIIAGLAATFGGFIVSSLLARLILGSFLPLPFFIKSTHYYEDQFYEAYRGIASEQFVIFLLFYLPLPVTAGLELWLNRRKYLRGEKFFQSGLLFSTLLFLLYHLFLSLQIMYYGGRFYQPVLPVLIFLTALAVRQSEDPEDPTSRYFAPPRSGLQKWRSVVVMLTLLAFAGTVVSKSLLYRYHSGLCSRAFTMEEYRLRASVYWLGLTDFSTLPGLVIATTDVGLPATLNPGKTVIDLAGLNDTDFALHGFSADRLLLVDRPDLIYMPHPDYVKMTGDILNHPEFKSRYDHYSARTIKAELGIALRKDSPHHAKMKRMLEQELERQRTLRIPRRELDRLHAR